jgi:hypothetical protein
MEIERAIPVRDEINPLHSRSVADYRAAPVIRLEHTEPVFTRIIEQQTAKIPSHVFLFASFLSMGLSLALELGDRQRESRFVGMWAPSLLIMGLYNKIVKSLGQL